MQKECCSGAGKFFAGMAAGMAAGAALGMTMAPSQRQIRRAAHKAAQKVNEAVDHLADAMDLYKAGAKQRPDGSFPGRPQYVEILLK